MAMYKYAYDYDYDCRTFIAPSVQLCLQHGSRDAGRRAVPLRWLRLVFAGARHRDRGCARFALAATVDLYAAAGARR